MLLHVQQWKAFLKMRADYFLVLRIEKGRICFLLFERQFFQELWSLHNDVENSVETVKNPDLWMVYEGVKGIMEKIT